jgi:hypothetical protein
MGLRWKLLLSLALDGTAMAETAVTTVQATRMDQMEAIHTNANEHGNVYLMNPHKEEHPASHDAAAMALKENEIDPANVSELIQQYADNFVNLFKAIEADASTHADRLKFGNLADTDAEQMATAFADAMAESVANAEEELIFGLSAIDRLVTQNEVALNAAFIVAQDSEISPLANNVADNVLHSNTVVRQAHQAILTAEKDVKELIRGVATLFGAHALAFKQSTDRQRKHNAGALSRFAADATTDLVIKATQAGKDVVKTTTEAIDATTKAYVMHMQHRAELGPQNSS